MKPNKNSYFHKWDKKLLKMYTELELGSFGGSHNGHDGKDGSSERLFLFSFRFVDL
jgi:hypothetical protein